MPTTSQLLTQAEAAYHQLVTGKAPRVVVDQNGERVEYNTANRDALRAYIEELRAKVVDPSTNVMIRRPMTVWF
jgi:hypothetical protein